MQQMRELMRWMNDAYTTENTYCDWAQRFIKFSRIRDKNELLNNSECKVKPFLTPLAVKQNGAASTQNQALNSLTGRVSKLNFAVSMMRKESELTKDASANSF